MIKNICVILWCLVLASCVTPKIKVLSPIEAGSTMIKPDEGILVFRLADATPRTPFRVNQVTIAPKDVYEDESNQFLRLPALKEAARSSSTYIAMVPANEYKLTSLRAYHHFGDRYYSKFFSANITPGTFVVEPGKITDLGTIALTTFRRGEEVYTRVIRSGSDRNGAEIVKRKHPCALKYIDNLDAPLNWIEDGLEEERFNIYSQAVQNPITFERPFYDNQTGYVTFPSRLGTMLTRRGFGDWALDALDSDLEILSFSTSSQGAQIALGEFEQIFYRENDEADWKMYKPPLGPGQLDFLSFDGNGKVYVARKSKTKVTLYSTSDIAEGQWQHVADIESTLGFGDVLSIAMSGRDPRNVHQQDILHSEKYLFISVNDELFRFSFADETITKLEPKISIYAMTFYNDVLVAYGKSVARRYFMRSLDFGNTWKKVQGYSTKTHRAPDFFGLPLFLSESLGYAVHSNRDPAKPYLIKTSDGGSNWSALEGEPLPEGCYSLVDITIDSNLSVSCYLTGEFYLSEDGGNSWKIDRERIAD